MNKKVISVGNTKVSIIIPIKFHDNSKRVENLDNDVKKRVPLNHRKPKKATLVKKEGILIFIFLNYAQRFGYASVRDDEV